MPTKQKSGLYRTKVKIGVNADGKDMFKYVSGKTKKELEDAKREVIARYIGNTGLNDDVLFGKYAQDWYFNAKQPMLSESTKASYRTMLNKYVLPVFGDRNMRSVTASELQKWMNGFAMMSGTTIAQAATVIRSIFGSALADRIIPSDPSASINLPKSKKEQHKRSLTAEETDKILDLIEHHTHGDYLACLYYTGARPGEVRGLMWGDFDWDNNVIHIRRDIDYKANCSAGALKTEAAYREVPIQDELRKILYPKREHPNSYLFTGDRSGKPWSKSTAERIWLDMMRQAGLVEQRNAEWKNKDIRSELKPTITPYYLRHNYITQCWQAGIDPMITMRIVGHTDYRTTANIYTHLQYEHIERSRMDLQRVFDEKKVAKKLHKASNGGGSKK